MECINKQKNLKGCTCTYEPCSRKGLCCECLRYHLSNGEVPGCFFPPDAEKTYNRSRDYFIQVCQKA
jgi:hypothetical protein